MQLIHGDCLKKMKDIPDGSRDLLSRTKTGGTNGL